MSDAGKVESLGVRGHYLYADYSPLEDDRNVIEMLRSFVSLSSELIRLYGSTQQLQSLLDDSDSLRKGVVSAIRQIRSGTAATMEDFASRHSDVLATELRAEGLALLTDAKNGLAGLLDTAEKRFAEQHEKYRQSILARIEEKRNSAGALVHSWLCRDYLNLPKEMLGSLSRKIIVSLDGSQSFERYSIRRVASCTLAKEGGGGQEEGGDEDGSRDSSRDAVMRISYAMKVDPNEMEFWNRRRKVSDLGIKDLMLPVGMKAPLAEKLKQTFRLGSGDAGSAQQQPEFRKVDDYYILSAELQDSAALVLQIAPDLARPWSETIRVTYAVGDLPPLAAGHGADAAQSSRPDPARGSRPRIDVLTDGDADRPQQPSPQLADLLRISEIEKASDLPRIELLGAAAMAKMRVLADPAVVAPVEKLELLSLGGREIVSAAAMTTTTGGSPSSSPSAQHYYNSVDFDSLFEFLRAVAALLGGSIRKLEEKTPVKDELIMRQELEGGQRKEFALSLGALRSQLADSPQGKSIQSALGI